MGIGRCKDLDEWLVGSGESAETADSKRPPLPIQGSNFTGVGVSGAGGASSTANILQALGIQNYSSDGIMGDIDVSTP